MNAPVKEDAVRVPHDVAKISAEPDEKVANASYYVLRREDHTLGNLLRMELLRDVRVKFAGYKHPHPLDNDIRLRVQVVPGLLAADAPAHPTAALVEAARRLEDEFRALSAKILPEIVRMGAARDALD